MRKKIYSPWANTENEKEKSAINMEIYKELNSKYKIAKVSDIDRLKGENANKEVASSNVNV